MSRNTWRYTSLIINNNLKQSILWLVIDWTYFPVFSLLLFYLWTQFLCLSGLFETCETLNLLLISYFLSFCVLQHYFKIKTKIHEGTHCNKIKKLSWRQLPISKTLLPQDRTRNKKLKMMVGTMTFYTTKTTGSRKSFFYGHLGCKSSIEAPLSFYMLNLCSTDQLFFSNNLESPLTKI